MRATLAPLRHLWHWRTALGLALGGAGGAAYSLTIGCTTGGCALTSNPVVAAVFGALVGLSLLAPAKRSVAAPQSPPTP
jgi:hypothetical protein